MNYAELYTNTRIALCKAIAEHTPDGRLDINCPDPLNPTQTFVGVYKFEEANYIECRLADGTFKSDSIYALSVDQAYEVLKVTLAALGQWQELYTVEVYNGGKWISVLKTPNYHLAQAEYEKRCKSWPEVRLQKWN